MTFALDPRSITAATPAWWQRRWVCGSDTLALAASVYFALATNGAFLSAALSGRAAGAPSTWGYGAALVVLLVAVQFVLLALVFTRRTAKPVLAVLLVVAAVAVHGIAQYGIYLDPAMLRNALKTDAPEVRELITPALWRDLLLFAGLPLLMLSRIELKHRPIGRALLRRVAVLAAALGLTVAVGLPVFQDLASLMRNHKELRYLVTPTNAVYSFARSLRAQADTVAMARTPVGTDATLGPAWGRSHKPVLLVVVVGETARSANWGLSGYARQTTPGLAARAPLSAPRVDTCGTDTETSVPCMFSRLGRRSYDEARIHREESLLHVLSRTGLAVQWIDNQSGCKGVCDGLPLRHPQPADYPALCNTERCLDTVLLHELDHAVGRADALREAAGPARPIVLQAGLTPQAAPAAGPSPGQVLVLHMLGNHGPAYYRRYPADQAPYQPACAHDDLSRCSREEIVNAYDNALRASDTMLSDAIDRLAALQATHDVALLYVSDHGESLGEHGLYLHGMPYAIAPIEQKQVPLVLWFSDGYAQRFGIDRGCLRDRLATGSTSHDHLFHTLLGLLDVHTTAKDVGLDLASTCRR